MINNNPFFKFILIWSAYFSTLIGSVICSFAITVLLTQHIYSDSHLSGVLIFAITANSVVYTLVHVLTQPVAGVITDRLNKKNVMILSNLINCILMLLLASVLFLDIFQLWLLLLVTGLNAFFSSLSFSAYTVIYVNLLPDYLLNRANGFISIASSSASIVAPIIGVSLVSRKIIGFDGITFSIALSALFYIFLVIILYSVNLSNIDFGKKDLIERKKSNFWYDFKEGFHYLSRPLLLLLSLSAVGNLVIQAISTLNPLIIKQAIDLKWETYNLDYEQGLASISVLSGIGGFLGGLVVTIWGGLNKRRVNGVSIPLIIAGAITIPYGYTGNLIVTGLLNFSVFFVIPIAAIHSNTIWQSMTPKPVQGRVFAIRRLIAHITLPLGGVIAGLFSSLLNPAITLTIMGLILLIYSLFLAFNQSLLEFEEEIENKTVI